jgi:endonuclease I
MKKFIIILTLSIASLWAQIPTGYYSDATGLSGAPLHQALHDIIDNHTVVSYGSLWTHYQTTDAKQNGKVWDMYSDIPGGTPPYEFTFVSDQCGNYGGEGDCYNREHSWPKSWFNDTAPMNTDIFHVVPSDGYVNGQRGNYPYGEVSTPNWTSANGSKRGANTYPGYSGTVFEPIDAYKGDFARIYFYMSTRYLGEDSGWPGSPMVDGAQLETWALNMMMEWHTGDPVSQKEIARNNANYGVQNNRNPFVDHPEYVDYIWGDQPETPLAPSDLEVANITDATADLTWIDNSDNEDGFHLYQDGELLMNLQSDITSVTLQELTPGQLYTFSIHSYNGEGESAAASVTFTTTGGSGGAENHFVEDFEMGSGSGYVDGNITLSSGVWNAYQAGNFTLGTPLSGVRSLTLNDDKPGAQITTPEVNTVGSISFYYYQRNGSAGDEFRVEKSINGAAFELVMTQGYNVGENYTLFSAELNDTSSAVRMRIVNDNQTAHLIIDDLTLTQFNPVSIDEIGMNVPTRLTLNPAYPNPFNPEVTISFHVNKGSESIQIQVFDIQGQLVDTPVQNTYMAGTYSVMWQGTSGTGEAMPSGVYLVKLSTPAESQFQRITLLR